MYQECKSYADQSKCVLSLCSACIGIRQALGYQRPDVRSQVFHNVQNIAEATAVTLNFLDSWVKATDAPELFRAILGLKEASQETTNRVSRNLLTSSRLGLCVLAQFQIENCLTRVALKLPECQRIERLGFFNVVKCVLEVLDVEDRLESTEEDPNEASLLETLNVPAWIRNSLHGGGYHDRRTVGTIVVGGVTYEFRKGEKVSCASVPHIAHALEESLKVLKVILDTEQVRSFDYIEDRYTKEMLENSTELGSGKGG